MKIVCNKSEFAKLVRNCEKSSGSGYATCSGCVFSSVCSQAGEPEMHDVMCVIEDICEIVSDGEPDG